MAHKTTGWHTFSNKDDDQTMMLDAEESLKIALASERSFEWDAFDDDEADDSVTTRLVDFVNPLPLAPVAKPLPLAAVVLGPQIRGSKSSSDMPPTIEIPMILLDVEDARTPADWERVSVEMDAADPLDLLLQSVDTVLQGENAGPNAKSSAGEILHRNTRPMAAKPQPYKPSPWVP